MRWEVTPYLNNSMLPATRGLADGWQPGRHSVRSVLYGYEHGDKLWRSEHGISVDAEEPMTRTTEEFHMTLLERLFHKLNADDRPNGSIERSLSVGDVAAISTTHGTTYYACDSVGWKKIAPPTGANILNP